MRILVVVCTLLVVQDVYSAISEKQMKAALKLVRNMCQPKSKAPADQIDGLHQGNWDVEQTVECYLHCILKVYRLQKKDNSFDWENGIVVLQNQAPASIGVPGIESVKNCKGSVKTPEDKCRAAYEIAKCVYEDNPANYFLP